jgi:formylmethanofuran dehydrogenase subunit E
MLPWSARTSFQFIGAVPRLTMKRPALRLLPLLLALAACGGAPAVAPRSAPHDAPAAREADALEAVAAIHGGAGPWAVAGYRMGERALSVLGLPRGSFDLEVVHHTPHEVQLSCIADGAAAATGASLGKLNLALVDAKAEDTRTTYRRRSTGQSVTLRVTASFRARFADVPRARLGEAGREVLGLEDDAIFEELPAP